MLFFGGKGEVFCLSVHDGLCIDASRFSGKEGRDDDTCRVSVEKGDAPALVAPGILEWIKSDDTDFVYADGRECPDILGDSKELLNLGVEIANLLVVSQDDRFEISAALSFEKHLLAFLELTRFSKELSNEEKLCNAENSHKYDSPEQHVGSQEKGYAIHRKGRILCVSVISGYCSIFPVAL